MWQEASHGGTQREEEVHPGDPSADRLLVTTNICSGSRDHDQRTDPDGPIKRTSPNSNGEHWRAFLWPGHMHAANSL